MLFHLAVCSHPILAGCTIASALNDTNVGWPDLRCRHHHRQYDDDFVYEDQDHEEDTGAGAAEDAWDPTEFYYDDDPEDFELHTQQRRKSARQQQHQGSSRRSEPRNRRSNSPTDAGCSWAAERAAQRAAADRPAHEHGREVLARTDVCLVCGSSGGTLVSGHVGQTGRACARQYHAGCLLLLNAVGIRSVTLARSGQGKQRQQQRRASRSSGGGSPAADGSAQAAAALSDGLLGVLWQQALQPGNQLSLSVLAAISAAQEAAIRVASGELALCCPSHSCHGCQLNGKQEVCWHAAVTGPPDAACSQHWHVARAPAATDRMVVSASACLVALLYAWCIVPDCAVR